MLRRWARPALTASTQLGSWSWDMGHAGGKQQCQLFHRRAP